MARQVRTLITETIKDLRAGKLTFVINEEQVEAVRKRMEEKVIVTYRGKPYIYLEIKEEEQR